LNSNKNSTAEFICSTLVWRAYYEGTGHTLDISKVNLLTASPGSWLYKQTPVLRDEFIQEELAPVLALPETFVRSPLLRQIF
jgi:hypothetical protein